MRKFVIFWSELTYWQLPDTERLLWKTISWLLQYSQWKKLPYPYCYWGISCSVYWRIPGEHPGKHCRDFQGRLVLMATPSSCLEDIAFFQCLFLSQGPVFWVYFHFCPVSSSWYPFDRLLIIASLTCEKLILFYVATECLISSLPVVLALCVSS